MNEGDEPPAHLKTEGHGHWRVHLVGNEQTARSYRFDSYTFRFFGPVQKETEPWAESLTEKNVLIAIMKEDARRTGKVIWCLRGT